MHGSLLAVYVELVNNKGDDEHHRQTNAHLARTLDETNTRVYALDTSWVADNYVGPFPCTQQSSQAHER